VASCIYLCDIHNTSWNLVTQTVAASTWIQTWESVWIFFISMVEGDILPSHPTVIRVQFTSSKCTPSMRIYVRPPTHSVIQCIQKKTGIGRLCRLHRAYFRPTKLFMLAHRSQMTLAQCKKSLAHRWPKYWIDQILACFLSFFKEKKVKFEVFSIYLPVDSIRKSMFCVWGLFKTRQTTYKKVDVARL
jgi:hypothetical protein